MPIGVRATRSDPYISSAAHVVRARRYLWVVLFWTARATGDPSRTRSSEGREKAVISNTVRSSEVRETMDASSPCSGWPGSVPYAKPWRSVSSMMYTMRTGATT